MIRLLIYDLDGTLIDSRRDIASAVNWTLEQLELPVLPMERIESFVGSGVKNLMEQTLKETGAGLSELERSIKLFRKRYGSHLLEETKLFPSVPRVLEAFRKRKQAIVTNKPQDFSLTILEGLGIRHYFFSVIGGDAGFRKKPAPDTVLEVLRLAQIPVEEALIVGDSAIDVETGKNAGIATLMITSGFGKRAEIEAAAPDYLVNDLEEILGCPLLKER